MTTTTNVSLAVCRLRHHQDSSLAEAIKGRDGT
jgi:hypothetical protein